MSIWVDMTTQQMWDNFTSRHRELEAHIETLEAHIDILKAKVFDDNSWASIETHYDKGD